MKNLVFYDGPSMLDGSPIFAALVGLTKPSTNTATGTMLQVYIMRSDIPPIKAVNAGLDSGICGACIMRGRVLKLKAAREHAESLPGGKRRALLNRIVTSHERGEISINIERACYVRLEQAPTGIFKAYKAGKYKSVTPRYAAGIVARRELRIGAYGDSAALPISSIKPLASAAGLLTNYSHAGAYATGRFNRLAAFTMASADSIEQAQTYWNRGFRTFRVTSNYTTRNGIKRVTDLTSGESQCPKTIDKKITCIDCGLCDGNRRGLQSNIVAPAHGKGSVYIAAS